MPAPKGNQYAKGHGRPALTPSVKKALKALQKGSPRAAARLLELVESEDAQIAVAAIKVVLAKTMPDLKHEEKSGSVEVVTLGADERRAAVEVLRTLTSGADGSAPTRH